MKRILQYESLNALLAFGFFALWFLINLHHSFSGLPIEGVALLLFLGFFVTTIAVPAYLMLLYWIFLQFISGVFAASTGAQGGVAFMAHLGGFFSGALLIKLFARPEFLQRRRQSVAVS